MASKQETRAVPLIVLCLIALVIGIVTGYGAVGFRYIIAFVHNLSFYGVLSFAYEANEFPAPSRWGPLVILVPVIGGLGVVYLVKNFAPEAKGPGVGNVIDTIYYREGKMRPVVALVKSLAAALSIGTGASVGREGPIVQIGSSIGSTLAQLTVLPPSQRITMVAAGAGAGIAATFNTPLGAVMFAVELMLPEFSTRTFLPVVIATGAATYIGRLFFGLQPAFFVPVVESAALQSLDLPSLIAFVLLGLLCGLVCWVFIRLLGYLEDRFDAMPGGPYVAHGVGMLLVGICMYLVMINTGHYHVNGAGYAGIQAVLSGHYTSFSLLALLFVAKLFATSVSIGSGAVGGVFAPSLFLGAMLGGAFGALMPLLGLAGPFSVAEFAMIGMAAVVGGATGAALTAIFMIFELTRDYNIIVPMILTVAVSIGVRRMFMVENVYTFRLAKKGHPIPQHRHNNMFMVRHATDVMDKNIVHLSAGLTLAEGLAHLRATPPGDRPDFIVLNKSDRIVGVIQVDAGLLSLEDVRASITLDEVADHKFMIALERQTMFDMLKRLTRHKINHVLVVRGGGIPRAENVLGVISKKHIADSVIDGVKPFSG